MFFILLLLSLSSSSLFSMMMSPYGMQQPTSFGGALSASLTAHNTKEAFKDQQEGAQDIDAAVDKFKSWLTKENILGGYKDLCNSYQEAFKRETAYATYEKTAPAAGMIMAPAGYRLPENRSIFPPLSDVMKKYKEVDEILDIHASLVGKIANKFTEVHRIADLTDMIKDWRSKYMANIRVGQAPPAVIKQVDTNDAIVTNLQTQISAVRDGITIYLTTMGIAKDAITNDKNDLEDMAQEVEGILANDISGKKLDDGSTLGQALSDFIVARYTGPLDELHNPFTLPLKSTADKIVGIPAKDLQAALADYRQELLTAAKKIRDRAVPKDSTVGSPDVYFNPNMIPPDLGQMEKSTRIHRYMYPGYLGYWLQQIIDHLHEITLLGGDIIAARIALSDFADALKNECLVAATVFYPDLAQEPIINDITTSSINLGSIVSIIKNAPSSIDALKDLVTTKCDAIVANNKKIIDRIRDKSPEVLSFTSATYPNGVPELFKLRRTLLLIALLKSIVQKQPFSPATYTSDMFGDLQDPDTLFPQVVSGNQGATAANTGEPA